MAFTIFNSIQQQILPPFNDVIGKSSEIVAWMTPLILTGMTISLMIYGFEVIRGAGGHQYFLDALAKVARPFMVANLALLGGAYSGTVVPFFQSLRTDLAGVFGAKGQNSYAALDSAMTQAFDGIVNMIPIANQQISITSGNFQGFIIYACMALIGIGMLLYGVVAAFNLIVVDASIAILLGIGPLFVACFAFQLTAKFTDSWLSAMLKYTLTAAIITMVIGMCNMLIQKFGTAISKATEGSDVIGMAAATIAGAALLVGLVMKSATLAADVAGGVQFSLTGAAALTRATGTAARAAAPAAQGAANAGAYVAGAVVNKASNTGLVKTVLDAGEKMRSGSAGQAATSTGSAVKDFASAVSSGSMGAAYSIGRGSNVGTGTISGGRPVPTASSQPLNWPELPKS